MSDTKLPQLTPGLPVLSYNPYATYEKAGARYFTNGALQSAIDLAAARIGDAPFVAVAHHEFNQDGTENTNVTKLSFLVKTPDGKLSVAVAAYKDWNQKTQGAGAEIAWRPF